MYQNQLFFEDFQKVFKVKVAEQKNQKNGIVEKAVSKSVDHSSTAYGDIWFKRLIIRLHLQSMLH